MPVGSLSRVAPFPFPDSFKFKRICFAAAGSWALASSFPPLFAAAAETRELTALQEKRKEEKEGAAEPMAKSSSGAARRSCSRGQGAMSIAPGPHDAATTPAGARWLPGKHQTIPDMHRARHEHCQAGPAGLFVLKSAAASVQLAPTGKCLLRKHYRHPCAQGEPLLAAKDGCGFVKAAPRYEKVSLEKHFRAFSFSSGHFPSILIPRLPVLGQLSSHNQGSQFFSPRDADTNSSKAKDEMELILRHTVSHRC